MKQWQIEIVRWYNYSLEALFLYVLIFPLFAVYGTFPPVLPYITVIVVSAIVYGFLLQKTKSASTAAIGIPIVLIVGGVVGFSIMMAAFLAVIAFWRAAVHYQEYDQTNEFSVFLMTLAAGTIYFVWFNEFDGRHILLILIFAHFLLAMGLKTLSMTLHSNVHNEQKTRHIKWIGGVLLSIGTLSVVFSIIFPYMQWVFIQGVRLLFFIGGLIATPFVYLVSELASNSSGSDEAPGSSDDGEPPGINFDELEVNESFISFEQFFWVVTGIILLLVVLYVINKIRTIQTNHVEFDEIEDYALSEKKTNSFWSSFRKERAPKNEIRRLFYHFQGSLAKTDLARKENETVEDWISNLPMEASIQATIINIYRKVRYGNFEVSREELTTFKQAIKDGKKQIKEAEKNAS